MWKQGWRQEVWSQLNQPWDLIIIGGGITGAGILREATRVGYRALLVDAGDFATGTSSRSSKLVHGGFRYLKNGQVRLTYEAVRERERLLRQARGLINPLGFFMPSFKGDQIPGWVLGLGLTLYDLLALKWGHRHYPPEGLLERCPYLREAGLLGGYRYFDAQTDDARLVLRIIRESVHDGGVALNYARVISLLRDQHDHVCGIVLRDEEEPNLLEIEAPVVINATGAWADEIRIKVGGRRRLRHLRGSHLVFPADQFPLTRAISFLHPTDSRPVFAFPWEGVTVLGTTDVDHGTEIETDPAISPREAHYLLTAGRYAFPVLDLRFEQVLATFSGIRAVLDTGKADPSKESREHFLWEENGLVTVTGGKLTTFRIMAHDALESIRYRLPGHPSFDRAMRMLDEPASPLPSTTDLAPATRMRLAGRYGSDALALLKAARAGELANIGETPSLWAELRWAARSEGVVHLDDLLLRRVRVGIITAEGGLPLLKRVRSIVQPELGWNDERWAEEVEAYTRLWTHSYSPPHFDTSPADQRLAA